MKFRHKNIPYDTDELEPNEVEDIARTAAYARNIGKQTLEVLGFEPDHEFEPRKTYDDRAI